MAESPYRLPTSVVPERYELDVATDLTARTFEGTVRIALDVREPVREIVLNAVDLDLRDAVVRAGDVEIPVREVLFRMKCNGVLIDSNLLGVQSHELGQKMLELEQKAFTEAGQPFNLNSPKQIAEIFFKTLGLEKTGVGSADSARRVVERQMMAWGARPDGFAVRDGSGLSRHDYVTPETITKVLDAMRTHPQFKVFYDALPIAGVDGTIGGRMRGTPAQGNVHAKTGSVDKARSLSGYVTTADGRQIGRAHV